MEDTQLALHVCKLRSNYDKKDADRDVTKEGGDDDGGDGDVLNLGFKPFDGNFMRSYIRKARSFEPMITDELQKDIVEAYVSLREEEKRGEIDSRKSYTTPRTLLGIMRLSQAHARARFSHRVERQDFDEAIRLIKASKESVELSAPAKKGANPLDLVYDIVADLSKRAEVKNNGYLEIAHVVSMAGHKALTKEMVDEALDNWASLSVLVFNDKKTMVKFVEPTE